MIHAREHIAKFRKTLSGETWYGDVNIQHVKDLVDLKNIESITGRLSIRLQGGQGVTYSLPSLKFVNRLNVEEATGVVTFPSLVAIGETLLVNGTDEATDSLDEPYLTVNFPALQFIGSDLTDDYWSTGVQIIIPNTLAMGYHSKVKLLYACGFALLYAEGHRYSAFSTKKVRPFIAGCRAFNYEEALAHWKQIMEVYIRDGFLLHSDMSDSRFMRAVTFYTLLSTLEWEDAESEPDIQVTPKIVEHNADLLSMSMNVVGTQTGRLSSSTTAKSARPQSGRIRRTTERLSMD